MIKVWNLPMSMNKKIRVKTKHLNQKLIKYVKLINLKIWLTKEMKITKIVNKTKLKAKNQINCRKVKQLDFLKIFLSSK